MLTEVVEASGDETNQTLVKCMQSSVHIGIAPLESVGKIAAADPVKADEAHEFWRGTGAVVYGIDDVLYGAASTGISAAISSTSGESSGVEGLEATGSVASENVGDMLQAGWESVIEIANAFVL